MFKRLAIFAAAASAVALLNSAASAADAIVQEEVVIVDQAAATWSGFYAGGHLGYAWADRDWNGEFLGFPVPEEQYDFSMDGMTAGVQVGYNWQIDNFVFGVEGDAAWADASETKTEVSFPFGTEVEATMDWMATVRGRVGYTWDRFMIYGTGGVAFAGVDTNVNEYFLGFPISSDGESATHTGWTLGLGAEAMVTEKVSVKLEYLHADFGNEDYNYSLIPISPDDDTFGSADLKVDTIRVGVNFHF